MLCVEVYDSFDAIPATAVAAFEGSNRQGFFSSWFWYRNLYDNALARTDRLRLYLVRRTDAAATPLLLMPMVTASARRYVGLRTLRACANFYSPLFVPLTTLGSDDLVPCLHAWIQFVAAERPRWDVLSIAPLDRNASFFAPLCAALGSGRFTSHSYFCFGNWHHRLASIDYADYLTTLPGQMRSTVTRKSRALKRDPAFRIVLCQTTEQVAQAQLAYEEVFSASWKRAEPYPDFIPGLIAGAAQRGVLRLGIAYIGEQAAACQLWLVQDGVASIFKLAYADQFGKRSVGTVLTDAMMRHAVEVDHVSEFDFLSGDDGFKRDWMSDRRERHGCVAFNQLTLAGRWGGLVETAKRKWRRLAAPLQTRHVSRRSKVTVTHPPSRFFTVAAMPGENQC